MPLSLDVRPMILALATLAAAPAAPAAAQLTVEPFFKGGTMAWDQLASIGGHKSLVGTGLVGTLSLRRVGIGLEAERWWLSEGLDDDAGYIPRDGHHFRSHVQYALADRSVRLGPFAGVGYHRWYRRAAAVDWESLRFFYAWVGVGAETEGGYIRAAFATPFGGSTDTHLTPRRKLGFISEGGLRARRLSLGLFYQHFGLQDPDAKAVQAGVLIGYRLGPRPRR